MNGKEIYQVWVNAWNKDISILHDITDDKHFFAYQYWCTPCPSIVVHQSYNCTQIADGSTTGKINLS